MRWAFKHDCPMKFVHQYERMINWIVSLCPAPDKFAHTFAGLAIWLLAALLLGKPLRSWAPLLTVIALECANEYMDYLAHGGVIWNGTGADMAATWFWPVVLFLALRIRPRLRG